MHYFFEAKYANISHG